MKVKGTALLGRKATFIAEFGESRWDEVYQAYRRDHPALPAMVLPSSLLDLEAFLGFNDLLVERFYGGNQKIYWDFGERSAQWAFTEGPYRTFLASRDFASYVPNAAALYRNYFPEGQARGTLDGDVVTLEITDVPIPSPHPYLEYSVCGFFKRGLEMVGAHVRETRVVRGYTKGDKDVKYEFLIDT